MAINILDDEVLKRNRAYFTNVEETKISATEVKKTPDNDLSVYLDKYVEANENSKEYGAIIEGAGGKTPIEINATISKENATQIISEGSGAKTNATQLFQRVSTRAKDVSYKDIYDESAETALEDTNERDVITLSTNQEIREATSLQSNVLLRGITLKITKLQDKEGNLIDPENAVVNEEYTIAGITTEGKEYEDIDISTDLRESILNTISYEKFSKDADGAWNIISVGQTPEGSINQETISLSSFENREKIISSRLDLSSLPIDALGLRFSNENTPYYTDFYFMDTQVNTQGIKELYDRENWTTTPNLTTIPQDALRVRFSIEGTPNDYTDFYFIEDPNALRELYDRENWTATPIISNVEAGRLDEFQYDQMYTNDFWMANNWFGEGRAKQLPNQIGQKTVDINNLEIRENLSGSTDVAGLQINNNRMREMSIFLFMLFPYIGTSIVNNIRSAIDNPDPVGLVGAAVNSVNLLFALKYFTPGELVKYAGHNFYTLMFFKSTTVKNPPGGIINFKPGGATRWDGYPDLFFGQGSFSGSLLRQLKDALFSVHDSDPDTGAEILSEFKDGRNSRSPFYEINYNNGDYSINYEYNWNPKGILDPAGNNRPEKWTYPNRNYDNSFERGRDGKWEGERPDGRWNASAGNSVGSPKFRNQDVENRAGHLNSVDDYMTPEVQDFKAKDFQSGEAWEEIDQNTPEIQQTASQIENRASYTGEFKDHFINEEVRYVRTKNFTSGKTNWSSFEQDGTVPSDSEMRARYSTSDSVSTHIEEKTSYTGKFKDHFINKDVNASNMKSPIVQNRKWEGIPADGIVPKDSDARESFKKKVLESRPMTIDESLYVLNDGIYEISFPESKLISTDGWNDNNPGSKTSNLREALKRKSSVDNQIGRIVVKPVVDDSSSLEGFEIPFEFNPDIQEGGVTANYEATAVLSRIGELQSYSGTGPFTVTIETSYIATSDKPSEVEAFGQSWMAGFTLKRLQAIEFGYRSLVYPHHPDTTDKEQGYRYVKPPIIRVVIGGADSNQNNGGPYSNLLTYQTKETVEGRLESADVLFGGERRLRNFIATDVTINKSINDTMPIVLDSNGRMMDTMGFSVSLSLTEVTTSYMDTFPDYKGLSSRMR